MTLRDALVILAALSLFAWCWSPVWVPWLRIDIHNGYRWQTVGAGRLYDVRGWWLKLGPVSASWCPRRFDVSLLGRWAKGWGPVL